MRTESVAIAHPAPLSARGERWLVYRNCREAAMLTEKDLDVLAQAWKLDRETVGQDAALVDQWRAPADDLLQALRERREWEVGYTTAYLAALRRALQRDSV